MLRKANQKRFLDDIVIQKGGFDWRSLIGDDSALTQALGHEEDYEDAHAASIAAREVDVLMGADREDFEAEDEDANSAYNGAPRKTGKPLANPDSDDEDGEDENEEDAEGATVTDYMLAFAREDWEYFCEWRL